MQHFEFLKEGSRTDRDAPRRFDHDIFSGSAIQPERACTRMSMKSQVERPKRGRSNQQNRALKDGNRFAFVD